MIRMANSTSLPQSSEGFFRISGVCGLEVLSGGRRLECVISDIRRIWMAAYV